ncbi:ankycorbin isoform X1 [Amia ocellicauda]|uniref:ankycorbin isoform X1 n=1 Tax=Amia ocellicauda TaxID=2972642 RepID=UPI003464717F
MKSLKAKFRKSDGHEWNKNDDRLLGAVEHGETDKVTSLLAKKGVNAVKLDSEGKSALHLAAAKGQAECLGLILAHGADASVLDASGSSALHLAAKNNHQECAKKLIQQSKCAIEALDNTGKTALHHTAVIGSVQFIRLLCEHKCPVNVKDVDGNTPLLLSARHAQADACRSLVEHGADINACDKNGRTAVMLASESSSVPTVQVLIEKGADLTLTDSLGHDVLHYAKLSGNPEVKSLLQVTLGTEKTTPKQIQHDQVTKLNEERSTTPKKRKAPPPPLSPPQNYQSSDFSSPPYMTPTQTPLSTKDDSFMEFSLKGDELKSIALKEEIEKLVEERNTLVDTIQDLKQLLKHTQPDMAHNGNEEESVIITLQAKIASLSLENQQLAQILKKRSAHQTEEDSLRFGRDESRPNSFDSNASFHSTKADFDQSTDSHDVLAQESEESVLEESTLDTSNASVRQKEGEKESEEEVKLLRDALQSLQIKLQESQLENQSLQAKLLPAGSADALQPSSEDLVENVSELKEKIKETQCKYEEAMQQVLALKAERCLEPVASDENNTIPNLQGLQVMYEDEIKDLKEKLSRALEEQERDANLIKQLESKLETMDNRVSAEQCEEMKQSYSMLVDNINQEKALLIDKYKEAQEDIKMLQEALKGTVPVEAAAKDFEEMKAEMGQTIDGLQRRLLELSHSYSEAKSELSAARNSLSTSPLEEQRLKEYVTKEHHDQVTQDFARRIEEMKEGITETDARYREALKEIVLLKEEAESQKQSSVTISDHMQVVSSLGSAIKELEAQVGKLKEELSQKMLEVDSLKQQLSAEKSTLREDSIPRRAHEELKDALESEIRQLTVNLQQALRKQDELSLEVAQAWQEVKEVKNEKQTIQGIATSKDQENNELQARYKEAKELVSHLKKQVESFSDIEEDKDKKIEDLTKEVSKLKDALNSLSQLSYTTGTPKRQNQQVDSLQQQVKQLQFQLSESKKQHQEIVSVYRMHLLYAVQGQMDEDVQKALKQILMMCKMPSQAK